MTQFTLKLVEDQDNPVIILDPFHNATALIDTGAKIPVWLEDEKDIQAAGGILKQSNIRIKGLSQKVSTGNLYTLSNFQIGKIIYTKLDIVVLPDKNTTYNILLSATMFRGMIYEIDDINHRFNVNAPDSDTVRNLAAYYDKKKDKVYVYYNQ